MRPRLHCFQFLILSILLTVVQPVFAEDDGASPWPKLEDVIAQVKNELRGKTQGLDLYYEMILKEHLEAAEMTHVSYKPNLFNYEALRNTTKEMLDEWRDFEANLQPRVLYHWASDYEVEQIRTQGLEEWLKTSAFFWRSPLGSFMYGENRAKTDGYQSGPNLIRIKLKPRMKVISWKQFLSQKGQTQPNQLVSRRNGLIPIFNMRDFTRESAFDYMEYVFVAPDDRDSPEQARREIQIHMNAIESLSINHPSVGNELEYEAQLARLAEMVGLPHFDSYVRINGIPTLTAPEKNGIATEMTVDGHKWNRSILELRVRQLQERISKGENQVLIYNNRVTPEKNPHFQVRDLEKQIFTGRAYKMYRARAMAPAGSCRILFL